MTVLNFLIINCDSLAPLVPLGIGLRKKSLFAGDNAFITYYLLVQILLNSVSGFIDIIMDADNIFIYQINSFVSLFIITLFFHAILKKYKIKSYIKKTSWGLLLLVGLYIIFIEPSNIFNSHSFSYVALLIVLYSLLFFYNKVITPDMVTITKEPVFWFVTGLFIYYATSFFIFMSFQMFTDQKNVSVLWKLHNLIFVFMCIYLTVGFLCKTSQKTY